MAVEVKFTEALIKGLVLPDVGRAEYKDAETPGLYLRVTSAGVKSFSFIGRTKGSGKTERITLGKWPAVKVKEAQGKVLALAADMAAGESAAVARRTKRDELTIDKLLQDYIDAKGKKRPDKLRALFRLYIKPAFGGRKLSELDHIKVGAWHRALPARINARRKAAAAARAQSIANGEAPTKSVALRTKPTAGTRTANQALSLLHALYKWAIESARTYVGDNPAHGIQKFPEIERERFLTKGELPPFFKTLQTHASAPMRCFFFAALMTGARRANVLSMRWDDLDLAAATWRLPETKNGKPQTVTLAPELVDMLTELKANPHPAKGKAAADRMAPWVFASAKSASGHLAEPKGAWATIRKEAGLEDVRIHDLRRTLGSWQAGTGASLPVIGKSLNHKSSASTQIYARLDMDPVRQSVDRATSAMLEAAGVKPSAEVVPIKRAAG